MFKISQYLNISISQYLNIFISWMFLIKLPLLKIQRIKSVELRTVLHEKGLQEWS
ncbi:MAG: hypothetical protein RLZZ65_557 [Bacteroidota bacterium]